MHLSVDVYTRANILEGLLAVKPGTWTRRTHALPEEAGPLLPPNVRELWVTLSKRTLWSGIAPRVEHLVASDTLDVSATDVDDAVSVVLSKYDNVRDIGDHLRAISQVRITTARSFIYRQIKRQLIDVHRRRNTLKRQYRDNPDALRTSADLPWSLVLESNPEIRAQLLEAVRRKGRKSDSRIFQAYLENPEVRRTELARALGISDSYVCGALRRVSNLVRKDMDGVTDLEATLLALSKGLAA